MKRTHITEKQKMAKGKVVLNNQMVLSLFECILLCDISGLPIQTQRYPSNK